MTNTPDVVNVVNLTKAASEEDYTRRLKATQTEMVAAQHAAMEAIQGREKAIAELAELRARLAEQAECPGTPSVRIGPVTYTVTEHDWPPDKDANSQAMGRTVNSEGRIMLLASMPHDVKCVTLWHEIIHAILDQAGQDASEGMIEALSHGIVATLRENRWLRTNTP